MQERHLTLYSRQYDPVPSPNTTNGKPDGTPVPKWTGPSVSTFIAPFGKFDLLAYMNKYVVLSLPNLHQPS
jgi:ribonuclease T2